MDRIAGTLARKTRVLVIDDSALMRRLISDILSADPELEVVGTAHDPIVARTMIKATHPDVLTLDVEMPRMDGLTFLRNLMRLRPTPVVMVSTLTTQGATATLEALELGAVDFVSKPTLDLVRGMEGAGAELVEKVKAAARARVAGRGAQRSLPGTAGQVAALVRPLRPHDRHVPGEERIIAIGASTGGPEALRELLTQLGADMPPIVIAQHIPPVFSRSLAARLDRCCPLHVCEAEDGQAVLPAHVFIAPGNRHLEIVRDGTGFRCRLSDAAPVNRHRPSVDVLFHSVARCAAAHATGVLLTGMGRDGAAGLRALRDAGARTIAQDEASSVVWGMPGAAVELGAAEQVLPLEQIAPALVRRVAEGQLPLTANAKE